MKKVEKHSHKLKRHVYNTGNKVYFCVLPECSYKVDVALSLGKRIICWRCDSPFNQNEYSIRLAKPHCPECQKKKDKKHEVSTNEVSKTIAHSEVHDLRSRLSNAIPKPTEDVDL